MPIPEVVRLSLQHAADLANKVDDVTYAMANKWLYISQGLDDKITQVSREIKNLQAQGKPVTEAWLNEQKYYKSLQEQASNQIANYVDWAQNFTEQQILQAALIGINDASSMYMYSTSGMGYFKGIPAPQIESIQAITMRDAPLGQLFQSIKPSYMGFHPLTEALMSGLTMGMPMTEIAKLMKDAVNMPYSRSVLIARTEVNRAHRSAALRTYQEYDVPYYRRMASREHACFACMMLDGTLYTSKEALDDHPNGACAMVPVLDPNDPSTDWEHGEQRFEKMSEEEQRRIMGNNYYDSWKRGDFGLKDVTIIRQNPIWGGSPGMRPLKDLSPNWRQYVPKREYTPRAPRVPIAARQGSFVRNNPMTEQQIINYYNKYGVNAYDKYPNNVKGAAPLKMYGEKLGTNGLPVALTPKEFDALAQQGQFVTVTYRAVEPNTMLNMTAEQVINDYRYNKDMYVGFGVYGNGTYTNPDAQGVVSFYGNDYFRMGIDKSARIANSNELYQEWGEFVSKTGLRLDMGDYGLLRGYDVIYCEGPGHYNILNRTITYVVKEDPLHFN